MPELPEVETIVRELRKTVLGKQIKGVHVYLKKMVRPDAGRFCRMIKGIRIRDVERLGKYIILVLGSSGSAGLKYVVIHLKMTGQLLYHPENQGRSDYVHVKISFKDNGELLYRDMRQFGFLHVMEQAGFINWKEMQGLGPDPLKLKPEDFVSLLRQRKGRVKPLLLNQRLISGLGNIYVDESLFAAGIHPLTPAMDIPEERCLLLHREMRKILNQAIRLKGSTVSDYQIPNGRKGRFQDLHRVYRRQGQSCPVCDGEITRIVVAGRGTHICPGCQKIENSGERCKDKGAR